MGFFGHLVAARADLVAGLAEAAAEPGAWASGLQVARIEDRSLWMGEIRDSLADRLPGGFLAASVWDSDGALLVIGVPGRPPRRYWLGVDAVLGHLFPPWAPFDDEGEPLSPEETAAQDAEWEAKAASYRDRLLRLAIPTEEAARLCDAWARASGLTPGSPAAVREALESSAVFVEDVFLDLLNVLGGVSPS